MKKHFAAETQRLEALKYAKDLGHPGGNIVMNETHNGVDFQKVDSVRAMAKQSEEALAS